MASGHVNRIQRPNTWLQRPMLQNREESSCQTGAVHTWHRVDGRKNDRPAGLPLPGHQRTSWPEVRLAALPPKTDIRRASRHVCFVPILLQKSVSSWRMKILELLMRFRRSDARDHIV